MTIQQIENLLPNAHLDHATITLSTIYLDSKHHRWASKIPLRSEADLDNLDKELLMHPESYLRKGRK